MAFKPTLGNVIDDMRKDADDFIRKDFQATALQLFSLIVEETPVDKGSARGGWQPSVGVPNLLGGPANPNKTITSVPKNPLLLPYFLSNPLPYIEVLEFGGYGPGPKTTGGFSKLAPRGMIRTNMKRLGLI
jgi:hypothetical protein